MRIIFVNLHKTFQGSNSKGKTFFCYSGMEEKCLFVESHRLRDRK